MNWVRYLFFKDYTETQRVYHIAPINDLKRILTEGIAFDDKVSYNTKYYGFHGLINKYRTKNIPTWVDRSRAIFASMNYKSKPTFHSHTVVLAVRINEDKCWVANENKANQVYEPFVLQEIKEFRMAKCYLEFEGEQLLKEYWETSLSFEENLMKRRDLKKGYDAEVLILHSIPPEDIEVLYIVSDHRILRPYQWKEIFCR